MKCPFVIKKCTKCNKLLVAYSGNFKKNKSGKWGLNSFCKECDKKCHKQWYEENKEKILEHQQQYREEHKEEVRIRNKQYREEHKEEKRMRDKQYYQDNKEERLEYQKQYYQENKEEIKEYQKQYNKENKEKVAEVKKQYYENHKEKTIEYQKQYYQENKEKILEYQKQYSINNPHIVFNARNKRRSRLENQGRGITGEQWYEMMKYFDWCCAYSGEYIGGNKNKDIRSIDHIIALDNDGLNEPWNCVPMFRPYNSSKRAKEMEEWYKQQPYFSEERLIKIYTWCEYAWNKWKPRRKGNKKYKELII